MRLFFPASSGFSPLSPSSSPIVYCNSTHPDLTATCNGGLQIGYSQAVYACPQHERMRSLLTTRVIKS